MKECFIRSLLIWGVKTKNDSLQMLDFQAFVSF